MPGTRGVLGAVSTLVAAGAFTVPRRHASSLRAAAVELDFADADAAGFSELADAISARGARDIAVLSTLEEMRAEPFFALYSIDMLANCPYIGGAIEECEFDACEILPEEELKLETLSERDARERVFELDSWARMDVPSEDYYSLVDYPEGYTGYNGSHVWEFIYEKLAFVNNKPCPTGKCAEKVLDEDDSWRHVFDRSLSGVHSSIAAHVADGLDDEDECYSEYQRRVGAHPDRVSNLHFVFAIVLTALREARIVLSDYDYNIGLGDEVRVESLVKQLIESELFDDSQLATAASLLRERAADASECVLASGECGSEWIEESGIWQMRQRSRAMLRVMDCVQCGACRLHGKVCWFGVATALKLIYSDTTREPLMRVEVAALITTLAKLAHSVRFAAEMEAIEASMEES